MASFTARRDQDGNVIGWQAHVRKRGFPTQTKTCRTKKEAEAWAAVIESEITRGVWRDRSEAEGTTLRDAMARYALEVIPAKKGARQELLRAKDWQARPLAQMFMASIRGKDVAAIIKNMEAEGKGPNTIRLHLALLSHLFTVARTEWGMETLVNPVELVRRPRLPQGRERRLVGDEESLLLDACRKVNPELAAIVTVAIETAMRQGEILGMTWDNVTITLKQKQIFLPDTKNGTARWVPLSCKAVEILQGLPRRMDGRVWGYTLTGVRRSWSRALAHAGIEGLHFHDLRHEATSRLFEKGFNPMEVSTITGHKTLQMLKRYTHLRAEDLAKRLG
jgi:integrase